MKITKNELRTIIREELLKETNNEYQEFFKTVLDTYGKTISQMSDAEKKEFFTKVKEKWNNKNASNESACLDCDEVVIDEASLVPYKGKKFMYQLGDKYVTINKNGYVVSVFDNSARRIKDILVGGQKYRYNPVYKTYNSVKGNELLHKSDVEGKGIKAESLSENKNTIYKKNNEYYVNADFLNFTNFRNVLGSELKHMGGGYFYVKTSDGQLNFDRTGDSIKGISGRAYRMRDDVDGKLVDKVVKGSKAIVQKESKLSESSSKDLMFLIDQLVNSMEHYNEREFVDHISGQTKFDKSVLRKIFKAYWKLPQTKLMHWDNTDWKDWLTKMGLKF